MDMANSTDNAADRINHVCDVLRLLADLLSQETPGHPLRVTAQGVSGLWLVLTACEDTLKKSME